MKDKYMHSESKFWLSIWALICASLVVIALAVLAKSSNYNTKRLEALGKTADPIAFACAEQLDREAVASITLICSDKAKK